MNVQRSDDYTVNMNDWCNQQREEARLRHLNIRSKFDPLARVWRSLADFPLVPTAQIVEREVPLATQRVCHSMEEVDSVGGGGGGIHQTSTKRIIDCHATWQGHPASSTISTSSYLALRVPTSWQLLPILDTLGHLADTRRLGDLVIRWYGDSGIRGLQRLS